MPEDSDNITLLDPEPGYSKLKELVADKLKENSSITFNYDDPKGFKEAKSHVAGLRKVKSKIEKTRKALKADALEYGRKVDGIAKELKADIAGEYAKIFSFLDLDVPKEANYSVRSTEYQSALDPAIAGQLATIYAPYNARLFEFLGREISSWRSAA